MGRISVRSVSAWNGRAVATLFLVGDHNTAVGIVEDGVFEEFDMFWGLREC